VEVKRHSGLRHAEAREEVMLVRPVILSWDWMKTCCRIAFTLKSGRRGTSNARYNLVGPPKASSYVR